MNYRNGKPLVAALCTAPIVSEAVADALAEIAHVIVFPADGRDAEGLLRALSPDAVVVDRAAEAEQAAKVARDLGLRVIHVSLRGKTLRVLKPTGWVSTAGDATAEAIRNAVVEALFGRELTA